MQNKSNFNNVIRFIESLRLIRIESETLLPINNSFIRYDLLNIVILYELQGKQLSIKKLYSSIKYSDIGIRNHLIHLVENDWLKIEGSVDDKRVKIIHATEKLWKKYEKLFNNTQQFNKEL